MAELDFPASPAVNDTYTANGKTWQWDGTTWRIVTSLAAAVPIQKIVCAGGETSVEFANIPQNFTDLELVYSGRDTASGSTHLALSLQCNGDTTSGNYTGAEVFTAYNAGASIAQGVAATSSGNAVGSIPGVSGNANAFASGFVMIPNYTSAVIHKGFRGECFEFTNEAGAARRAQIFGAGWKSNAPITSLKAFPGGTAFAAGTTFMLYGKGAGVPVATMPSSGLVLLASTVAAGSPAALAVSGLSADYTDLVCRVHGRGNGSVTVDDMRLLINGDTTAANYTSSIFIEVSGGSPNGSNNSPTSAGAAVGLSTGVSGNANALATTDFTIFGYKDPLFHKEIHARSFSTNGASAQLSKINTFSWKSLAVVTALSLGAVGSTWADGSTLKVFGRL